MTDMTHAASTPQSSASATQSPMLSDRFNRLARAASRAAGHHATFTLAVLSILLWAVTGPAFHWSETWQLVINTGTTIVTFLMVFLIQNTQNRDSTALHLKIDELIRANLKARNMLLNLEDLSEQELEQVRKAFCSLAEDARKRGDLEDAERLKEAALRSA